MRLPKLTYCLSLAFLLVAGTAFGQRGSVVTLTGDAITAGEIVMQIEHQTDYTFVLDYKTFATDRVVRTDRRSMPLSDLLDKLVSGAELSYTIKDNYIIISKKAPVAKVAPPKETPRPKKAPQEPAAVVQPIVEPAADSIEVTTTHIVKAEIPQGRSAYSPLVPRSWQQNSLPLLAVKANLLYAAGTLTPNLGLEVGTGARSTFELTGSWNPWNRHRSIDDYKQFMHWIIRAEYRWWLCERFSGHFFGAHVFGAKYNVSGYTVPLMFDKNYRYEGWAVGAGISYGYHLPLARKWGLEFNIGIGGAYMKYDRFDCRMCATEHESKERFYFGPTRAGVSLIFMIK